MSWPLVCHLIIMPTCKSCTQTSWEATWTVPRVSLNSLFCITILPYFNNQKSYIRQDERSPESHAWIRSQHKVTFLFPTKAKFPFQGQQLQRWKAIHSSLMWIGPRLKRKSSNHHSSQSLLTMVTLHRLMRPSLPKPFQIPLILKILQVSRLLIPLLALIG